MSDDSKGELYSPSQSTDVDEDRMKFVVEEEAEEDDGTHVEETPQVHSANEVVAGAQELDVQVVVASTAAENTPEFLSP
jgi:methylmalonyl-CoA mutase cobalamin-binding subunit